jgi:hypothetical protein
MDQANAASNPSIARDYIKTGCAKHSLSNSNYKNRFFESPPTAGFQKNDFGVSSAFGAGNTKIVFIMRIAGTACFYVLSDTQIVKL